MISAPGRGLFFILCLSGLIGCQTIYRLRYPVKIHEKPAARFGFQSFQVYYEAGTNQAKMHSSLQLGYEQCQQLQQNFFPDASCSLEIILFRNQAAYIKHAGHRMRRSQASYSQQTGRLRLVMGAPQAVWRHELVHALLSQYRTGSYRVQEGLAYFLQGQDFSSKPDCSQSIKARPLSREYYQFLRKLQQEPLMEMDQFYYRANQDMNMHYGFVILSANYMYYLYQQGLLSGSLQHYLKYRDSSFEYPITRGDRNKLHQHHSAFGRWLRSEAPTRPMPGC